MKELTVADLRNVLTSVILLVRLSAILGQEVIKGETCTRNTFQASCNGSDVIFMMEAVFGRPKAGRCISGKVGFLNCQENILPYMHQQCSGRTDCSVSDNQLIRIFKPCSDELVSFLLTSYRCQPVTSGVKEDCRLYNETRIDGTTGFFHSSAAYTGEFGTPSCPWVVTAAPGQRLQLMIHDFTLEDTVIDAKDRNQASSYQRDECSASLVIDEIGAKGTRAGDEEAEGPDPREGIKLCDGSISKRHVYTTKSNAAKIHINFIPQLDTMPYFLISYEAVGCPLFEPPENMWATFNDDFATFVCNFTGKRSDLICNGTSWSGELSNCTKVVAPSDGSAWGESNFPWGILIAVVVGVAIGTVVGLCLLGLVFLGRKCLCPESKKPNIPTQQPSLTAREVPPMNELIRSANAMAKQTNPHPQQRPYSTYQRSPHPYTTHKFAHQVEYHPQGSVASREEHVYESYIYKDGTIRSRKGSGSDSAGSRYWELDGTEASDINSGIQLRIPQEVAITQPTSGAHPMASGEIEKN